MSIDDSFSLASKDLEDFEYLLVNKISQLGRPSLAFIFANADLDLDGVHDLMDSKQIPHIGASSYGELCDKDFQQGMYTGLFMYLPKNSFKVYQSEQTDTVLSGNDLGRFAKESFKNPGIYMLIASMNTQTDIYIKDVQKSISVEIPLYGGHAIDNLKFEKYTVFSTNHLTNRGVVAVVFDCDQLEIIGDSFSGWDSIGATHVVTKSEKNEMFEIDDKPALDVFSDYFDYFDLDKIANGHDEEFIIGNHPIQVIEENGGVSLKSPIHVDLNRKSMIYYCSIPVGTRFRFCTNPKLEITDNLINRIKNTDVDLQSFNCFLITSCASRQLTLGPFYNKEVKQLYELWNKPMAGFLSGGEIGNIRGVNMSCFHNVTCIYTGFKLK